MTPNTHSIYIYIYVRVALNVCSRPVSLLGFRRATTRQDAETRNTMAFSQDVFAARVAHSGCSGVVHVTQSTLLQLRLESTAWQKSSTSLVRSTSTNMLALGSIFVRIHRYLRRFLPFLGASGKQQGDVPKASGSKLFQGIWRPGSNEISVGLDLPPILRFGLQKIRDMLEPDLKCKAYKCKTETNGPKVNTKKSVSAGANDLFFFPTSGPAAP